MTLPKCAYCNGRPSTFKRCSCRELMQMQWETAQAAIEATIATMEAWLAAQPPNYEQVGGEQIDNTQSARDTLQTLQDTYEDLSMVVCNRLL